MSDENQSGPEQAKDVDTTEYYKILDCEKTATTEEIKKKYRKRCVQGEYRHPDRGGENKKYMQL